MQQLTDVTINHILKCHSFVPVKARLYSVSIPTVKTYLFIILYTIKIFKCLLYVKLPVQV